MSTAMFGLLFFVLQVNQQEVEGYPQLPSFIGYFLIAFGNGVGNIHEPSYTEF
jgi:hypothetical protein